MTAETNGDTTADLEVARGLIRAGIPVFAARPALDDEGQWDAAGGTDGMGFWLPVKWQKTVPTEAWLDPAAPGFEEKAWRPGWALCALMGCGLDLLDVDPRNGGDHSRAELVAAGLWPAVYGGADTPSGGTHEFAASLGVGSRDGVRLGLDVKGGLPDGEGRGFAFIAPTRKVSKTTGAVEAYRWTSPPDLDGFRDGDDSGDGLAEVVRVARQRSACASTDAQPASGEGHGGPIPDGQRHSRLVSYAGSLRRRDVWPAEALVLFRQRWENCAQPQPGSTGKNSPDPLPYPDARWALDWHDAQSKLLDVYSRYARGEAPDDPRGTAEATEATEPRDAPSWAPIDLTSVLDGSYSAPVPTLLVRTDGQALLYAGLTHSCHGESESGKSLLLQIECARLVQAGLDVLFLDFESDEKSVTGRLLTFGASPEAILRHFHYVRPQCNPYQVTPEWPAFQALLSRPYALAVIDGVTDALSTFGAATKDNDDITDWNRKVPRRIADRTGAAVVLVDHVVKDSDSRGRFAIGGQAKMNGLTGAAYTIEVAEPLGLGLRGVIVVRVAKDRIGNVRPHCGGYRKTDRTQEAARVVVDSRDPCAVVVTVEPPRNGNEVAATWRPTALMERASRIAELEAGLTKNNLVEKVGGTKRSTMTAIDVLVEEGYLNRSAGPNNSQLHTNVKPYRQADDPLSDVYDEAGTTQVVNRVVSGSSPYTGELGTTTQVVLGTTAEPPGTTRPGGREDLRSPSRCGTCDGLMDPVLRGQSTHPTCEPIGATDETAAGMKVGR